MNEKILLKVAKGSLEPADGLAQARLRERGYRVGDILSVALTKPRNPAYHRYAHQLGKLLIENLDEFRSMNPHDVLKRLQYESGIGCEEAGVQVPGVGLATVRWPKSLSFASMDQGEFEEVLFGLCQHVAEQYWTGLDAEGVAELAEAMPREVA